MIIEGFTVADFPSKEEVTQSASLISHTPEKYYDLELQDYEAFIKEIIDILKDLPEERVQEFLDWVSKGYIDRYREMLHFRGRVASPLVVGPSKFPSQERKLESLRKREEELENFKEKVLKKAKKLAKSRGLSEIEATKKEIEELKHMLEVMKEANKIIKSKKLSKEEKEKKLREIGAFEIKGYPFYWPEPDYMGRLGFPSFDLDSVRRKIKQREERLKRLEEKEEHKGEVNVVKETEDYKIVEDYTKDRVLIYFTEIPSEEVREALKKRGFRWSPHWKAWSRKLTKAAVMDAEEILAKFYKEEGEVSKEKEPWEMTKKEWLENTYAEQPSRPTWPVVGKKRVVGRWIEENPIVTLPTGEEIRLGHIYKNMKEMIRDAQKVAIEKHKEIIKQALEEGKPVPPEVLKDYPDLVEKYKKEAEKMTEEKIHFVVKVEDFYNMVKAAEDMEAEVTKYYVSGDKLIIREIEPGHVAMLYMEVSIINKGGNGEVCVENHRLLPQLKILKSRKMEYVDFEVTDTNRARLYTRTDGLFVYTLPIASCDRARTSERVPTTNLIKVQDLNTKDVQILMNNVGHALVLKGNYAYVSANEFDENACEIIPADKWYLYKNIEEPVIINLRKNILNVLNDFKNMGLKLYVGTGKSGMMCVFGTEKNAMKMYLYVVPTSCYSGRKLKIIEEETLGSVMVLSKEDFSVLKSASTEVSLVFERKGDKVFVYGVDAENIIAVRYVMTPIRLTGFDKVYTLLGSLKKVKFKGEVKLSVVKRERLMLAVETESGKWYIELMEGANISVSSIEKLLQKSEDNAGQILNYADYKLFLKTGGMEECSLLVGANRELYLINKIDKKKKTYNKVRVGVAFRDTWWYGPLKMAVNVLSGYNKSAKGFKDVYLAFNPDKILHIFSGELDIFVAPREEDVDWILEKVRTRATLKKEVKKVEERKRVTEKEEKKEVEKPPEKVRIWYVGTNMKPVKVIEPNYRNLKEGQILINTAGEKYKIVKIEKKGAPGEWRFTLQSLTNKNYRPQPTLAGIERYFKIYVGTEETTLKGWRKRLGLPEEPTEEEKKIMEKMRKGTTLEEVSEMLKKKSAYDELVEYYRAYLEGLGIKDIEEELKNAEGDIKALAEAVDKGRITLKEAEDRLRLIAPPPSTMAPPKVRKERKTEVIKAAEIIGGAPEFSKTIPQFARKRLEEEMVNMPARVKEEFKEITKPDVLRDIIIHGFEPAKRMNGIETYYGDDYYLKVLLSTLFREVAKRFTAKSVSDYAASVILSKYNDIVLDLGIGKAFQHIWASLYHRLPRKKLEIKRMNGRGIYSQSEIVYALTLWKVLNAFGLSIPEEFENERHILSEVGVYG